MKCPPLLTILLCPATMLLVFVVLYVKEITTIRLPKLGFESFTGTYAGNLTAHWSLVRLPKLGIESFTGRLEIFRLIGHA